jgi:hypothetical protein
VSAEPRGRDHEGLAKPCPRVSPPIPVDGRSVVRGSRGQREARAAASRIGPRDTPVSRVIERVSEVFGKPSDEVGGDAVATIVALRDLEQLLLGAERAASGRRRRRRRSRSGAIPGRPPLAVPDGRQRRVLDPVEPGKLLQYGDLGPTPFVDLDLVPLEGDGTDKPSDQERRAAADVDPLLARATVWRGIPQRLSEDEVHCRGQIIRAEVLELRAQLGLLIVLEEAREEARPLLVSPDESLERMSPSRWKSSRSCTA